MRWFLINCLLLALASSETRQKRDLNYLTNLFTSLFDTKFTSLPSSLHTDPENKLFRDPSLGNKIFKVVTKENSRIESHPMVLINEKYKEAPQATKIEKLPEIADAGETFYVIPNESDSYDTEYKVKVPFEPIYSYKQLQNKEPVMTYTAHNNPDVSVNEVIHVRKALPKCIKQRIDQVVLMGANPIPTLDSISTKLSIRPHPNINIKYPGDKEIRDDNLELSKITQHRNMILRPKLTEIISAKRLPLINGVQSKVPTNPTVHPVINLDQTVGGDKTIGLIPPPYIPHATTTEKNNDKTQDTRIQLNQLKLMNAPLPEQLFSSYVYKQLNHHSSNPTTVVKVGEQIDTNLKTNINSNHPSLSNYVFIPPKVNDPLAQVDKVTTESKLDDSVIRSFQKNPIVVSDNNIFSYHQNNIDGSSITINSNNKGVFVDVKNSTVSHNRGDIPDNLM